MRRLLEIWIIVFIDVKRSSVMTKNNQGHDGKVNSVKDKGKTKGELSISQRKDKGSDGMA